MSPRTLSGILGVGTLILCAWTLVNLIRVVRILRHGAPETGTTKVTTGEHPGIRIVVRDGAGRALVDSDSDSLCAVARYAKGEDGIRWELHNPVQDGGPHLREVPPGVPFCDRDFYPTLFLTVQVTAERLPNLGAGVTR